MIFKGQRRWATLLILGALLAVPPIVRASTGKIAGTVKDAGTGEPLVSANVFLADTRMGATADAGGHFFILNVPPGTYTLKSTHIGYHPFTLEQVEVSAGLTTRFEVGLTIASIQVEELVVQAERPIIDKNATNAVRIVRGEDLEIMPFRGVPSLLALQTGVVRQDGELHVRGSRPDEIGYYADGADVRNPITGRTTVHLIDEALAEIQLQAGGFNAEYGGANAGIVLHQLQVGAPEWKVGFLAETDRFTSDYEKRLGTYSYGYSNQVLTLSGPVAGNQRVRAFLAGQRQVQGFAPVFWEGFEFEDLVDSGRRGGGIHWASPDRPDSVDLNLRPGNVDHTGRELRALNSTLLFDYYPFQVRVTGLYSATDEEINWTPVRDMLNQERLLEQESRAGLLNLRATHFLDPTTFYQAHFSLYRQNTRAFDPVFEDHYLLYNDSLAVARANPDFTPYSAQGLRPQLYDLHGFPLSRPGTPLNFYGKEEDGYWGLGSSLNKQQGAHGLELGFGFQRWTSRRYNLLLGAIRNLISTSYPNLEAVYQRYYSGDVSADQLLGELLRTAAEAPQGAANIDTLKSLIRNASRGDVYGFDEFGRPTGGEGLEAPRHPILASAYLQDKIEYQDLILNAGLRWDYFDADSWRFRDPAAPVRDAAGSTVDLASMQPTRTFHEFSPRLGLSFPVSDRTVFHVQYGRFAQMPALRDMYVGGARLAAELSGQAYVRTPTAFDIEPIRTTQYEIGFERQFAAAASFDITGFYRDVEGQVQLRRQNLSPAAINTNAYNFLQNGDFATTKGVEFVFKLRRFKRLRSELNYTLSDARGTGSDATAAFAGVENDTNLPTVISPLDFDQTHRGNLYLDYRFGPGEGGPVLEGSGVNLLFQFASGHPFTRAQGTVGRRGPEKGGILASDDPRNREPVENLNASTTPWTFQVNLQVDKKFTLFGAEARAYGYVTNLFNRKNVINLYSRTGNDADDGFLTDPELSQQIVEANGGEPYEQFYQAINLANRQHYWTTEGGDIYGEPRQLRFGVQLGL